MPAIFISHSNKDKQIAHDIMTWLKTLRFERVFLDFDKDTGIDAGAEWEKTLYAEIKRCHAVILVLTPNWAASQWCFAELTQARALGKVILPIICSPMGGRTILPDLQAVDLVDWSPDGLKRIEERLYAITSELARGFTFPDNRDPYPGIHALEAEDAAIYFGRDEETRAVIEKLEARRTQSSAKLVLIIGPSGAGKSSLLKAGVLPQLARRKRNWIVLPPLRPERTPLEALAKTLAHSLEAASTWKEWYGILAGPDAVEATARLAKDLRIGASVAATLLLPIDQFEELFTIAEESERSAFLTCLRRHSIRKTTCRS